MKNITKLTLVALLSCGALSYGIVGYDNTGLEKGQMHIMGGADEVHALDSGEMHALPVMDEVRTQDSGMMHALPVFDEVNTMNSGGSMSHVGEVNTQDRYPYSQPGYLDSVENDFLTGEMHNGQHRMVRPGPVEGADEVHALIGQ